MEMTVLKTYAAIQALPAALANRWWAVLAILVITALFGRRIYCRFVCPLGILQSLAGVFNRRRRVCSRLDAVEWRNRPVAIVRSVILAAVLLAGLLGFGWQWLDPYAISLRAAVLAFLPEFDLKTVLFAAVPLGVVLALAVAFGGRIWCNFACPVGTLLSLVGIRPWKGDKVKKCAGCDKCGRCFK